MKKLRTRKKECSVKGCRKTAVEDGKCAAHATVKDMAVAEKVVSAHRIEGAAKKIAKVRKTNELHAEAAKVSVAQPHHHKACKAHVTHGQKRDAFGAICFKAGNIIGSIGAYLDGK